MFLVQFVFEHPDARWPYARSFKAPADFKLCDIGEATVRLLEVAPRGCKVSTTTVRPCFWVQAAAAAYPWVDLIWDKPAEAFGEFDAGNAEPSPAEAAA